MANLYPLKNVECVSAFGIELRIIQDEDLPMIMSWHNQPDILPYMEDARRITLVGLRFWLAKIRQLGNSFAYVARCNGMPVGYAELKNINFADNSCEDGLIIFNRLNRGTGTSHKIMLCREIISDNLGIRSMQNKIHFKNEASIGFYKKYGARFVRKDGDFLLFHYSFIARRLSMEKLAGSLGLYEEFKKYNLNAA